MKNWVLLSWNLALGTPILEWYTQVAFLGSKSHLTRLDLKIDMEELSHDRDGTSFLMSHPDIKLFPMCPGQIIIPWTGRRSWALMLEDHWAIDKDSMGLF